MLSNKLLELVNIFESFQEGSVLLPYGATEFFVKTRRTPNEVYFSFAEGDMPVCYGNVSMIGYYVVPDGFVIYPKVESNSLQVNYIALFEE